ncbi:MAG: hypothetical protein KIG16_01360 [Eubacteriales bacterium]|nr:hypothetical protein [Eubacteriales bacterium]
MKEKHWGEKHLKKRGLASLLVVSIIAIAAVIGVVFAFKNSGRQSDVYAGIAVSVDKESIDLNIEVVSDGTDTGLTIADTEESYDYVTVRVGGIPSSADHRVFVDDSSVKTAVKVERVGSELEASNTGVNVFKVTGKNGLKQGSLIFNTASGGQSVAVGVTVTMVAKYMDIGKSARDGKQSHFGVREGSEPVDLKSSDFLSKYKFYAHKADVQESLFAPNQFPVIYRLKEGQNYKGVTLDENGFLTVSENADCVDQYIALQVTLPDMLEKGEWVDVPFYVFPKAEKIIIDTNAYKAETTNGEENVWDLIANREGTRSTADFDFSLDNMPTVSGYGVSVKPSDDKLVQVVSLGGCRRSLSSREDLGEAIIMVMAYPVIKGQNGEADIKFSDEADANVQIVDTFRLRVRNEFYTNAEVGDGVSFNLKAKTNKRNANNEEYLDAFFYEGTLESGSKISNYYDVFALNTANGKSVNMDADVEFELLVEDSDESGEYTGTYRVDGRVNADGTVDPSWKLFSILKIGYWSESDGEWIALSEKNPHVNYLNKFALAFKRTRNAETLISDRISSLTLRIKSVNQLSIGDDVYATCDIKLERTYAIDQFEVKAIKDGEAVDLTKFEEDSVGVALVYDTNTKTFNTAKIQVKGALSSGRYSQHWNTGKVLNNINELPFEISSTEVKSFEYEGVTDAYHYIEYCITADDMDQIEYYKDYPFTVSYPNGVETTFNIRVYPTVESLSMPVVSGSNGKIYQATSNDYGTSYDYARVAYVRRGFDYQFDVITPSVNVGAYAEFESIVPYGTSTPVATNTRNFDATQLPEGLYECTVVLRAYSQDVFGTHETRRTVYFIVVDPVGGVTLPSSIQLKGIEDSAILTLNLTDLKLCEITNNQYLHIELVQGDENVLVDDSYGEFNQYKITAKYLTNNACRIGFKIYKRYDFTNVDLDGKNGIQNEKAFTFDYLAGATLTTEVKINKILPNSLKLSGSDFVADSGTSDGLLQLFSDDSTYVNDGSVVNVLSAADARNTKLGITYAQWKNGKFEVLPIKYARCDANGYEVVADNLVNIGGIATAELISATAHSVTVKPVSNANSMAQYALVVYPRDSLRYVKTEGGYEYVMPDLEQSKIISLYVGTHDAIEAAIAEKNRNLPHDANSGKRNNLGGYNWIMPAKGYESTVAALTYTTGNEYASNIEANVYYFDDLYTVLGWRIFEEIDDLDLTDFVYVKKYVDGAQIGDAQGKPLPLQSAADAPRNRLALRLSSLKFTSDTNEPMYSNSNHTVYWQLTVHGYTATFYVVNGIENFDIKLVSENSNGVVARKNLAPDEYTSDYDLVTVQRGKRFWFDADLPSLWTMNSADFTEQVKANTSSVDYSGGIYTFVPSIKFEPDTNTKYEFTMDAVTAKVKVEVKGGVKYLDITQSEITLDGTTTATYDITVRSDRVWSPDLLNFTFKYESVYYGLFTDGANVAYINLAGGKAKLEFKLKCLNPGNEPQSPEFYALYFLQIDVSVVIIAPDVDPFYNISGSRLYVAENLANSPLAKIKAPVEDSAAFNIAKDGVRNMTIAHFAETNSVEGNKTALTLASNQTDSKIIYLDSGTVGGLLKVYPTPYYANIVDFTIGTAKDGYYSKDVQIGTDLNGKPITNRVTYSIGFTQMIYNEDEGFYQPYLAGAGKPKMVSSWSRLEGYKWTGVYYFRTRLVSDSQITYRVPNDTAFKIEVSIKGEDNAKAITQTMTLNARYRDSFEVDPDDETEDYAVCTMTQVQYQALGTTKTYDIAMPTDCTMNRAGFTLNGVSSATATIKSDFAEVTISNNSLSVRVKADARAIGETIEVRIPYSRPGDYVNPYLSVVIVPVYFEFDKLEIVDHRETLIQVASDDDLLKLQYRAAFKYNTSMSSSSLNEKMAEFNRALLNSSMVYCDVDSVPGEITVNVSYTYVNGVPTLARNADCRYAQTFAYEIKQPDAIVKHKEYLAVGTTTTYTFHDWDALHATKLSLNKVNNAANAYYGTYWTVTMKPAVKTQNGYDVAITVSLENNISPTSAREQAYKDLVNAGPIVINVMSSAAAQPQMELTIVPVYFTFDEFKLKDNPERPLVAVSTPTVVTVEAGDVSCAEGNAVNTALQTFNAELLAAQENLGNNTILSFKRVQNDSGILNFDFNPNTRELTRADLSNPVTAVSYLMVSACVEYVKGVPTLSRTGNRITTYIPVQTFGAETENNGPSGVDLEPAPNGRVRTLSQAIGTKVRYNVALPNTRYDSKLDKYEVRSDNTYVWKKSFDWNATINTKDNTITVTLNTTTALFNKTLVIMAYNQNGELMYKMNIIPAYFTVEQILLADHIDENPVLINQNDALWLQKLKNHLDYKSTHSTSTDPIIANFNFKAYMKNFRDELNSSSLVSLIDDANYVTTLVGVNFEDGIPTIANTANCDLVLQNSYRYEMYDGTPENTKAQTIGYTVVYNVNHEYQVIKISGGMVGDKENWLDNYIPDNHSWSVDPANNDYGVQRCVRVYLSDDENLFNHPIRIGIFETANDVNPVYILNIVPAWFTVEDLTVKDQNSDDRNIFMYYGVKPDRPEDLIFDPILGENYSKNAANRARIENFIAAFQGVDAEKIVRDYNHNLYSGDLRVAAYLDYTDGVPHLVAKNEATSNLCVRVNADFWYSIFGRGSDSQYPPMPNGPRTRTEVQAVGTKVSYNIDLNKTLSMDMSDLIFDDALLAERGWKATFADNVLTLELLVPDSVNNLLAKDLVFKFYAGSSTAFVLTIQPVLFEVTGIETYVPAQPLNLSGLNETENVAYRATVKYNNSIVYDGQNITYYIHQFNERLNNSRGDLFEIEKIDQGDGKQYLKLDAAIDYGVAGSALRCSPYLIDVENNPLNVVESYIKYYEANPTTVVNTVAQHYQAIGTTEDYYLGLPFQNVTDSNVSVDCAVANGATVTLVPNYDDNGAMALRVTLAADSNLIGQPVTIVINYQEGSTNRKLTMTIQPVWFVVEGFEVVNHPERHMWLITSATKEETVDTLSYAVRAHYDMDADAALMSAIEEQIVAFNTKLAQSTEQGGWAELLETETIGGQYLTVRAAVDYDNGVAAIEAITEDNLENVVYDAFEYARYSDKIEATGMAYPNVPRSRTIEVTIGYQVDYTLDIPDLGNLSNDLLALYYNDNQAYADDDTKLKYYANGSGAWSISVNGNNLHIELNPDVTLANSELKVFIYKNSSLRPGVNGHPDSYDKDRVAFVLTIHPVLFKVTSFALTGYNNDEIHVNGIGEFTKNLSRGTGANFVPVYEYANSLVDTNVTINGTTKTLGALMNEFTIEFMSSKYVSKTRYTGTDSKTYHFQVATSVEYNAFVGTPKLSDDPEYRIWKNFKVIDDAQSNATVREEYQALASTKTYYFVDSVLTDSMNPVLSGTGYTAVWNRDDSATSDVNKNYLTVTLTEEADVNTPIVITFGNCTLKIHPVYYEVLGFEPVNHPERAAWIIEPETTDDLQYRMITTDLSYLNGNTYADLRDAIIADVDAKNAQLSNVLEISLSDSQFIIVDAAVNYNRVTGLPEFDTIGKDKRNVVESVIKYRVWSAAQVPNPEHPSVMGKVAANQVIGKTKSYTLRNVRGQISYPYIWVEGAGNLKVTFEKSADGATMTYEKATVMVDTARNILKVQLPADISIKNTTIRVYVPYLTTTNGKEVWYSYCIEITPLLFELKGWTITGVNTDADGYPVTYAENGKDVGLYVSHYRNDCVLLTQQSDHITFFRYQALINRSADASLDAEIGRAVAALEAEVVNYIDIDNPYSYISIDGLNLIRNCAATQESNTELTLSTYIVYKKGVPELAHTSTTRVSNQVLVSTGYNIDDWENNVKDKILNASDNSAVQAIGTAATYAVEISGAGTIFTKEIQVVERGTGDAIYIPGERANLITITVDDEFDENVIFTVELAPVLGLCDHLIEICIPYAEEENAVKPTHCFKYYITPSIFTVEGFYLTAAENNYLALNDNGAVLELHVVANYSNEVSLRNIANLKLQSFETALNNKIRNQTLTFKVENVQGGENVRLVAQSNQILIQKIADITALNYITGNICVGYANGVPTVGSVNPATDTIINLQIQVSTLQGEASHFVGWDNTTTGAGNKNMQSIGTSRDYPLSVNNPEVIFYYEYIDVFNGGLKRGKNEYEFFAYNVQSSDRHHVTIGVTLRAAARNLNGYIEIRIPYTITKDGEQVWYYYSLQVKPVLFEIKGWKLKIDGEAVSEVTLNESAVEFRFTPDIISGPLTTDYYLPDDLEYVTGAIKRLEDEINDYRVSIADGYYYLVLNNTPQAGFSVNYSIYYDNGLTSLVRETGEASTTVMQVSANIAYGVTNFNKDYVDGAQAVTAYANVVDAQRITSNIEIRTTDKTSNDAMDDRAKVYVTKDNAHVLANLVSGVDYTLMEDIKISEIEKLNLKDGRWKPVAFPKNTTLDGNNFKIIFDAAGNAGGFDLSDQPTNIGMYTNVPADSVIKNVQIVFEHGTSSNPVTLLELDLSEYTKDSVNIGMLAGTNEGIITNCAVVPRWQFEQPGLTKVKNPLTGKNFKTDLPFNKDGHLFDIDSGYFFDIETNENGQTRVTDVYTAEGYRITMDTNGNLVKDADGNWDIQYDIYHNVKKWITPDRTNVAKYDNYSAMIISGTESVSPAKLFVKVNNDQMDVTVGGLVGTNLYMITNSRVLIDIELWGPEQRGDVGGIDEKNVMNSIVGGFVGFNQGVITSSYYRDGNVINNANANNLGENKGVSLLGGFVGQNDGTVQQSYAMGYSVNRKNNPNFISSAGVVRTVRNSLGGFAHVNTGVINNCLVNMVIWKTGTEGNAGGFVYENAQGGVISNCIENNNIITSGNTSDYYKSFVVVNGKATTAGAVNVSGLSNLICVGDRLYGKGDGWSEVIRRLTNKESKRYADIKNFDGFSMGISSELDPTWEVSDSNTTWMMTEAGPMLRAANDIAVSYRKTTMTWSPYLYNLGTAKNPYLVWNEKQFNNYTYVATATATESDRNTNGAVTDIEKNRQNNHLRLVNNITLNGIKDTYKIIYTGTLEGNGLTMSGISLNTVTNDLATMGLFGKTEYATIRNINFEIEGINATARYVGGIAGIAINTSFVDVNVTSTGTIKGANIVGGFAGLTVVFQDKKDQPLKVENYNLNSNVSVMATYNTNQETNPGANKFSSGVEYVQQTLYAKIASQNIINPDDHEGIYGSLEQGFSTAGGIFGFVTSNPNNYRTVEISDDGIAREIIHKRNFNRTLVAHDLDNNVINVETLNSDNSEASWFLKARNGSVINDAVDKHGEGKYYHNTIVMSHLNGALTNITGSVAGGLIGIMDETIELRKPSVTKLASLSGKYYLGGIVGINLGKIAGEVAANGTVYEAMNLRTWVVTSSVNSSYVYRINDSTEDNLSEQYFWGMSVGGIAGCNDGFYQTNNSGSIEDITINVNVLNATDSKLQHTIGGVVGLNGNYGYINNAKNTNTNVRGDSVQVSKEAANVGFYFGRIVGRGMNAAEGGDPFADHTGVRTQILTVNFPKNASGRVKPENFETPGYTWSKDGVVIYDNFFGIRTDIDTWKVQSMTMDEYYDYLENTLKRASLPERVEKLESWVRSLPVENRIEKINGQDVWVEVYKEGTVEGKDGVAFLKYWLADNGIFDDKGGATTLDNYASYLKYSAIGTSTNDGEFKNHLSDYRLERYNQAIEFFTYQDQNVNSNQGKYINGEQNRKFTWQQYEDYLLLKKYAKLNMDNISAEAYNALKSMSEDAFYNTYGFNCSKDLIDMLFVDPTYGLFVQMNESKSNVVITNQADFVGLINNGELSNSDKFSNVDPLQIYLNYVVGVADRSATVGDWNLKFAQYVYYMRHIFGKTYTSSSYNYAVPNNFSSLKGEKFRGTAVKASYVDYIYVCRDLDQKITIPEFIDLMERDTKYVEEEELQWVKGGHLGGGAARISTIGGLEMNWVDGNTAEEKSNNWMSAVGGSSLRLDDDGVIRYGETYSWDARTEFANARAAKGLTLQKYKEMVNLGGSLWELLNAKVGNDTKYATAEDYIFDLRGTQYNWSQAQKDFGKVHYVKDEGGYDMNYALAATTEGQILNLTEKGAIRAIYTDANTQEMTDNGYWYSDKNANGKMDGGEPAGVYQLRGGVQEINEQNVNFAPDFENGDGAIYKMYMTGTSVTIDLRANSNEGAALYVDVDENKMFGTANIASGGSSDSFEAGKDILALYQLEAFPITKAAAINEYVFWSSTDANGQVTTYASAPSISADYTLYGYYAVPDFYTTKEISIVNSNTVNTVDTYDGFYKIVRQIVAGARTMTSTETEATENKSDYLEEALWWRAQGFTAEEFDQIKAHAMLKSLTAGYAQKSSYTTRGSGYTLADDWTAMAENSEGKTVQSGFYGDKFTTAEYTEIVKSAQYVDGVWYSTYADYQLFTRLNNPSKYDMIDPDKVTDGLPETSLFNNPFGKLPLLAKKNSKIFLQQVATENELAEAMEISSDHMAYMMLVRAGTSTAQYVDWSQDKNGKTGFNYKVSETETKYFRLNHYIYYMQQKLDEKLKIDGKSKFDAHDFQWVLTQSIRVEIQYNDVTPEKRTNDLVEYRMNWITIVNGEEYAFITFRDYCEWINVYAYSQAYQIARGDYEDAETGETITSTDGWLTIEAFAVWKRMEKYENNVEYLNKIGTTAAQQAITAPIYKRKISTTIFPKIKSSGEQHRGADGQIDNEVPTFEKANVSAGEYGWPGTANPGMDADYKRPYKDRFEYNERYVIRKITRTNVPKKAIRDNKFAPDPEKEYDKWSKTYGTGRYGLILDETEKYGSAGYNEYAQLYIPYDYFEAACKIIKSSYSESNGFAGYHNYMKYWARNGLVDWICNPDPSSAAYTGETTGMTVVNNTYLQSNFWNSYNGTVSPTGGNNPKGPAYDTGNAYGWLVKQDA